MFMRACYAMQVFKEGIQRYELGPAPSVLLAGTLTDELSAAVYTSCKALSGDALYDEVSCRLKYACNCIHLWLSVRAQSHLQNL